MYNCLCRLYPAFMTKQTVCNANFLFHNVDLFMVAVNFKQLGVHGV